MKMQLEDYAFTLKIKKSIKIFAAVQRKITYKKEEELIKGTVMKMKNNKEVGAKRQK